VQAQQFVIHDPVEQLEDAQPEEEAQAWADARALRRRRSA
jgi:hypothetical protein